MTEDTQARAVMSVRHALLALLSEGPSGEARLRAEFASAAGEVRPPSAGQVHAALQWLERDGLAEPDGAGGNGSRRRFRITANGERELAGWLRRHPDLAAAPHDELATKVQLALHVPGIDVHEMVQEHRRYLVEQMQRWTRTKQGTAGHDLRAALAVDAELSRLDSLIRWLDAADGHLERAEGRLEAAAGSPWPAPPTRPGPGASAWAPPGTDQHLAASAPAELILISDADRDGASARLRDHYADGRLTREELDERVTAALNARTFGDLRRVLADLPESAPALLPGGTPPPPAASRSVLGLRGLLLLTLVAQVLLGVLLIADGGWPFPAVLAVALGFALIASPAIMIAASGCWRRVRRR